jgi:hypothetical protein
MSYCIKKIRGLRQKKGSGGGDQPISRLNIPGLWKNLGMKELRVPTRRLTLESSNIERAATNKSAFLNATNSFKTPEIYLPHLHSRFCTFMGCFIYMERVLGQ